MISNGTSFNVKQGWLLNSPCSWPFQNPSCFLLCVGTWASSPMLNTNPDTEMDSNCKRLICVFLELFLSRFGCMYGVIFLLNASPRLSFNHPGNQEATSFCASISWLMMPSIVPFSDSFLERYQYFWRLFVRLQFVVVVDCSWSLQFQLWVLLASLKN